MAVRFRTLCAEDIECRIGSAAKDGSWVTLLLYKDARCDMSILDETVGAENWSREHYQVKNKDFCRVGINVNYDKPELEPRWVYKSDCGAESNSEAEKGESSDAFKRACFCWGIGRELYTSPFIYIPVKNKKTGSRNYDLDESGKPKMSLRVVHMKVEGGKITKLNISNGKYGTVYLFES